MKEPFNLTPGSGIDCRVRAQNSNGWSGNWSEPCRKTKLSVCGKKGAKGTWRNVAQKACCKDKTCSNGCNRDEKSHRHKYCHIHAEDKNRTRTRTRWENQSVTSTRSVIRPFTKTVKRMVMEKVLKDISKTRYVKKMVKGFKTIIHQEPNEVTTIKLVPGKYSRPVVSMTTVTHRVRKSEVKEEKRQENTIVLQKRSIDLPKLKYVMRHFQRRAVRMVKEMKTIEKEVPRTIPMPLIDFPAAPADVAAQASQCECFSKSCECFGEENCGCCFPACGCAPTIISPTETEIIVVEEECTVPQDYIETITEEEPSIITMPFEIEEPTLVVREVTITAPVLVWEDKVFTVPEITYVEEDVMVPETTTETVMVPKPMQVEVMKELNIPVQYTTKEEVELPTERDVEITEHRSVLEDVQIVEPVAVEYEEPIPNPPCHWHEITHRHEHDVRSGLLHTHNHADKH